MTEFNLSDRFDTTLPYGFDYEDVKEFIRLLKERFIEQPNSTEYYGIDFLKEVDKLAGDKLI